LAGLLDPELRKSVAARVSKTILQNQGARGEAKLYDLLKARAWAEREARKANNNDLPPKIDFGLDQDSNDNAASQNSDQNRNGSASDTVMQGNGEDPMIS
jgi:hypothetical protein